MSVAQAQDPEFQASCQRSFGRAEVSIAATLEITRGRFRCTLFDLSIEGAGIETDQKIEPGQSVWLKLHKLKIFCTVQWHRPGSIGVQFEQKLPKAFVLKMLGQDVDAEAYEDAEAMLAARDWVMGSKTVQPRTLTASDILEARNQKSDASSYVQGGLQWLILNRNGDEEARRVMKKRVFTLFTSSAVLGSLLGLGSAFVW